MKSKSIRSILLAFGLSYLLLFALGNLGDIVANNDFGIVPQLKLSVLQIFTFISVALCNFYIIENFMAPRKNSIKNLLFIGLMDLVVVYHVTVYYIASMGSYIGIGDILRDVHGINWYYMDYGGWGMTLAFFLLSVVGALLLFFMNVILNRRHKK